MWALISLQMREIHCSGWRYEYSEFIMPSDCFMCVYIEVIKRCKSS